MTETRQIALRQSAADVGFRPGDFLCKDNAVVPSWAGCGAQRRFYGIADLKTRPSETDGRVCVLLFVLLALPVLRFRFDAGDKLAGNPAVAARADMEKTDDRKYDSPDKIDEQIFHGVNKPDV